MRDFWIEKKVKKINKRKLAISIVLAIILIFFLTIIIIYNVNTEFQKWMDKTVLNKEVLQDTATIIELEDEASKVYAFDKNIAILSKNKFKIYNNFGNKENEFDIEITNPIVSSSNRYVAIGEKSGQKLYVIEDNKIAWDTQIEGEISQIHINKNGYVVAAITGTSYKTVISVYDNNGKHLFSKYLSSTRLADICISNDNKYLALAEVDTSGTMVQSSIKVLAIDKIQKGEKEDVEQTYHGQANSLIINVRYQDGGKLVCMYDNSIHIIADNKDEVLIDYSNEKVSFTSVELINKVVIIKEQSSGLFTADSVLNIVDTNSKEEKNYVADAVAKEIYTYENIIALNLGSAMEFINTDGKLVKRYIGKQEITNTVVSNSVAGIIYRDKVEVINL